MIPKKDTRKKCLFYGLVLASIVTMAACNEKSDEETVRLTPAETQEPSSLETRSNARSENTEGVQHGKYHVRNLTQMKLREIPELPELPSVPTPLHPAPSPGNESLVNLPPEATLLPPGYSEPPPASEITDAIKIPAEQLLMMNQQPAIPEAKQNNHAILKLKSLPAAAKSQNAFSGKSAQARKEFGIASLDQLKSRYQIKQITQLYTPPSSSDFSHLSKKKAERAKKFHQELLALGQDRFFLVEFEQDYDTKEIREMYSNSGEIESVEFQRKLESHATIPNDPELGQQWFLDKIQAKDAWDITTGSSNVIVAVLDSGVDLDHPDLVDKIWTNPGEIAGNGVDDDGNQIVDDIHGANFTSVVPTSNVSDNNGHGTSVAGVIAAKTNNGQGIAGVSWGAQIMPVRISNTATDGQQTDIAEGVDYAVSKGADVINISSGGSGFVQVLNNATQAAVNAGVVVVASTGNEGEPFISRPASYSSVIAVGSSDQSDNRVGNSNYGVHLDIVAPGAFIRTTANGGGYTTTGGTSLAAPQVSGTIALMLSVNSNLSPAEVRGILRQTAEDINGATKVFEVQTGYGRLNALRAVQQAQAALTGVTYTKGYNWDYTSEAEPSFSWAKVPGATLYAFFPSWPDENGNIHSVTLVGNGNTSWTTPSTQALSPGTYWVNVSALVNGVWSGWINDGFHVIVPEPPTLIKRYNNSTEPSGFFTWIWVPDPGATEYLFWGNWQPNAQSLTPPFNPDGIQYTSSLLSTPGHYWTHIATKSKNGASAWQPDWFNIQ